jgi:isoleucyl-tRNA synthetase
LIAEGLARELVHAIQNRRKELGCEYTDRIEVGVETEADDLRQAVTRFADYISGETLASRLEAAPLESAEPAELKVAGNQVRLYVTTTK